MGVVLIPEHGGPIAELNFILRAHPPSDVVRTWYMGLDDDDKTAVDEEVQQRVSQISLIWDEMRQYLSRALSEWFDAFR
ncbi:MAG: hypothetical protein GY803_21960, partial [Chloroflexi bacterium]|nr:hypothetical protein [Chloroflexota bacterium]